jgi:PAS domain S-box-containing protein
VSVPPEIFEALPDPVLVVDTARVLWVNRRFAELFGASGPSLVGRDLDAILSGFDRDRLRRIFAAEGEERGGILRVSFQLDDGSVRAFDVRVSEALPGVFLIAGRDEGYAARIRDVVNELSGLYLSDNGRAMMDLDALLAASHPIFERRGWLVAVLEIRADTAILRSLVAPEIVRREMPDGPTGSGVEVPIDRLSGMRSLVRSRVGRFHDHPPDFAAGVATWAAAMGNSSTRLPELMVQHGFTRGAWAPAIVRDQVRFVVGAVGRDLMQHDFAAVQLFAAQLSATAQMAELTAEMGQQHKLAALGQMSGLLAHEVRNPLAVMFQAYRQIRRRVGDKAEIGELMDIVEEEAKRLNNLVDDLVHFAGPIRPRVQEVSLPQIVNWAMEGLVADADFPGDRIELHVDMPSELPPVLADPALLRQAISHLVANACAHVRRGGNVWITATEDPYDRVHLKVVNDGEPLPPDVAFRVFEPFFTTKAKGTGLGLAVVRRLIEDQKGKVSLDRTDEGVSFSVWLPSPPTCD